ncbi:MAG TPA: NUDIX domain-containing protein [Beutenbergiaceae bacterium]|nr:NUDIX domain-containing protein [Beutenbergiaceae bacterium]
MTFLGADWQPGADGLRYRHAARVLVFDVDDRLLLARGHDLDNPTRHWWFTIGGGREPGESARNAAVRELQEETGIRVEPSTLVGPVLTRSAVFDFAAETVRQYEQFFLLHLPERVDLDATGWTPGEREMIDELRWWALADLFALEEQVYPQGLAQIAHDLLQGWGGTTIHLGDVYDEK